METQFVSRRRPVASMNDPVDAVRRVVEDMRFGSVTLTIHEGKIMQMDVSERHRFG